MTTTLGASKIDELKRNVRGEVILPGDKAYDGARTIWNAMIDKHPAVIVRCAGTADVVQAVNFARENRLSLAVRGFASAAWPDVDSLMPLRVPQSAEATLAATP